MKKSKYQQYFHCLLFAYYFHKHFGLASSSNYIVIDTVFRGVDLLEGRCLFQCGHPKVQCLLEGSVYLRPSAY